jgi:hypothetical protein
MILFWKRRQAFLFRSGGIKALPPGRAFAGQLAGSTRYRRIRNTAAGAGNSNKGTGISFEPAFRIESSVEFKQGMNRFSVPWTNIPAAGDKKTTHR